MIQRFLPGALRRFASRLRFPYLFLLAGAIFLIDVIIPDMVPFVDEVVLGLITAALGSWYGTDRGDSKSPPPSSTD